MANNNLYQFQKQLDNQEIALWLNEIHPLIEDRLRPESQRNFPAWLAALDEIPEFHDSTVDLQNDTITTMSTEFSNSSTEVINALRQLRPWRKGPFSFNGTFIDTEWRCDWKWQRIAPHIDLSGKDILDVGCGNGYYSLRMLGAGANSVVGMDTSLLYWSQFQAITRFTQDNRVTVLPLGVDILTDYPCRFNAIFSMGVLYHRRNPVEHLQLMQRALHKGGQLILETLILHGDQPVELIPEDRYANMRNVWSLPSLPLLMQQLEQSGFSAARCVNITRTTTDEQRSTEWMTFNSLSDALDPADPDLTIEGHPGPLRAVIIAENEN